ncbi:hypothetical protein P152DRAFT_472644 [Eremomyces bilateralis CBS 781.70]|uniref:Fungal N-terminal domain-containing protein n=1 Tax=Eremomyces bilateralis CBS 781.70 TaxID=1392243 RepID=A0A6G1G7C5_9PEZI|nr:uncharacterized protein P152DRAFT_472644 [Eremomyces bilateralis CBS 781.70]KAF1813836.1 hypothetical protein P152DRAFT_472644 [Eremomyces bilateralis CBS 781.70]
MKPVGSEMGRWRRSVDNKCWLRSDCCCCYTSPSLIIARHQVWKIRQIAREIMAEAFGIVAATTQLLEAAIEVFKSFKQAYDRQQDQAEFLQRNQLELLAIKERIEDVQKVEALQTASVTATLLRLKGPEERLVKWLQKVDRGDKKAIRRFVDQLIHGTKDRKKLEEIMSELDRMKIDLIAAISVAHINIEETRRVEKRLGATNKVMHVSDTGNTGGQRVPRQRQTRSKRSGGSTHSDDSGILLDGSEDSQSTDGSEAPANSLADQSGTVWERIITRNISDGGAIMLNARVGPDEWKESHVKITDNKAQGRSLMLNYPNERGDIKFLMELQDRREERALMLQRESGANSTYT